MQIEIQENKLAEQSNNLASNNNNNERLSNYFVSQSPVSQTSMRIQIKNAESNKNPEQDFQRKIMIAFIF